ncbi:MAG: phage tail terminator-like protein [Hyphomicrobium sp.]|uniref:phage tail terminator-like protein n=1 Tax=Hyphomicrobium sp. TaxID=82 RepID=UPI00356524FC
MAVTPEAVIPELLLAHMAALVLVPARRVAWPNISFTPVTGETYLDVSHLPNATTSPFLAADDESMYLGQLQVTIVAPLDKGIIQPSEIVGEVVAHFSVGTILRPADGSFALKIYDVPGDSPVIIDKPSIRIPVTIKWRAFI